MPRPLRVLIVEDDAIIATHLSRLVGAMGYEVAGLVATGKDAVRKTLETRPDVVLMDIRLRGAMTGIEAAQQIQVQLKVPVIYLTAYADEPNVREASATEPYGYLTKPVRDKELRASIEVALFKSRVDEERRQNQALLQAVIESSGAPVFSLDSEYRYTSFNQCHAATMKALYGVDIELGRALPEYQAADDWKIAKANLDRALAGERVIVEGFFGKDELQRLLVLVHSPVRASDGTIMGVAVVANDIGDRKLAEEALRQREVQLRSVIETTPDAIVLADDDGWITGWNTGAAKMFGYSLADIAGQQVNLLVPDGFRRRHSSAVESFSQTGAGSAMGKTVEAKGRRRSGQEFPIELSLGSWQDGGGRWSYSAIIRDITARKKSDEQVRRLAAAVEQAAEAIVVTETDGTIDYVNPAFEEVTGYSRDEAIGQNPRILKSDVQPASFYEQMWQTLTADGGRTWRGRMVNRRKDGSQFEEEATISPVRDETGKVVNFVAVKRDITQEVALEHQIRHSQKMETVGRLAGGVAHDFNNLLQALITHARLLHERASDPEEVVAHAGEIEQCIRRGSGLTRQLLLFSRQEVARYEPLDLNTVTTSALGMLRQVVRENVSFKAELAEGELLLLGDHGQIDQILMNLVVNASDAMPGGGSLTVCTGRSDDHVWVSVADTGTGIPREILEHIFEPFFTTKGAGKGTGLGLSVVQGIVDQHAGRIEVSSTPHEGTTFTVILPTSSSLGGPDAVPIEATPTGFKDGKGELILVVEDEEGAREGLAEILTMLGYRVLTAASAEEADDLPAEPAVDLVISDLMLPGMAGPELVVALRMRWPRLKVILMSGYPEDDIISRAGAVGPASFLQKPFGIPTLAQMVRSSLDR